MYACNVGNVSNVCMYVCMYVRMYTSIIYGDVRASKKDVQKSLIRLLSVQWFTTRQAVGIILLIQSLCCLHARLSYSFGDSQDL